METMWLRRVVKRAAPPLTAMAIVAAALPASAATIPVTRNVVYRTVDGLDLKLDVYRPPRAGTFPPVLVVHGGTWRSGKKENLKGTASNLARAGFVAFVANYRLAPPGGTSHSPAPVEDLLAAVTWIRAHAVSYRAKPAKVGVVGNAAGGHLAYLLATTGVAGDSRPEAVVGFSGPTDLTVPGVRDAFDVSNYIGCAYADCPDAYRAASPRWFVDAGDAALFIAHSEEERVPVAQARSLAQAAADAGLDHELHVLPGSATGRDVERMVWPDVIVFLKARLSP